MGSIRPAPPRVSPGVYTGRSRQTFQENDYDFCYTFNYNDTHIANMIVGTTDAES